ncbi:unnamed protein product [Prorocentrum cordatum]|uniref:Uncharacterized protein n=1 Tax=Prorocentrum cordatum TaxID=2364126 RepID=A0ABN9QG63_9DINO|nr:unnamed protein product [Polarella glacialis]
MAQVSFTDAEIAADLEGLPDAAFAGATSSERLNWVRFVLEVDEAPRAKHGLRFYSSVAGVLADLVGSIHPSDYSDVVIRGMITEGLKPGDFPFSGEAFPESWKSLKFTPAQIVYALRVQGKCVAQVSTPGSGSSGSCGALATAAPSSNDALAEAMRDFVKQASTQPKKGLSFSLADRIREVGLQDFPSEALPSEELAAKWEAAGRAAADRGRAYVGGADGDDLQAAHRPQWSRTPEIDVVAPGGSWEDRMRASLEMRRARTQEDRVHFVGFATFLGHVMTWGLKICIMKVCSPSEVLGYVFLLTRVAEEFGGVHTAYFYDWLVRREMARCLERGEVDISHFFQRLDREIVRDARDKAQMAMSRAGKAAAKGTAAQTQPKGNSGKASSSKHKADTGKGRAPVSPQLNRSRSPRASQANQNGSGKQRSGNGWGGW